MKFIQLLICLLVVSSLFLEISASENLIQRQKAKSQRKAKTAGIIDWLFGDWNEIKLEVTDGRRQLQEFEGKVRHVYQDKELNRPFGIEFQNLQVSNRRQQNNGFVSDVLIYERLVNQGNDPKPVLDLRQVKDCVFTDNGKDWFGDWTIFFSVVGTETYQIKPLSQQPFGQLWNVKMVMPAADRQKALSTKDKIQQACVARSRQINQLKTTALRTGDAYYALFQALQNRQQTLKQKVELGQNQQQVLSGVKLQSSQQSTQIQNQIAENQKQLQAAVDALKATQAQNQGAQEDVEKYSKSLEDVKVQLSTIQQSQKQVQEQIHATQSQLHEAQNLQNSQKTQAAQIAQNKQQLQSQTEAEKAELAKLVKEQEDKMKRVAEEFAAKQAELLRQQKEQQAELDKQSQLIQDKSTQKQQELNKQLVETSNKGAQVDQAIQQSQQSIESLLQSINLQQKQSELIDEQRRSTESSIAQIQQILEQKRDIANQLAAKLSLQSSIQQSQDKALKSTQAQGTQVLAQLAAQEKAQLDKLDQSNKEVQAAQAEAKRASDEVNRSYLAFNNAINEINNNARSAAVRTQLALEKSSINLHGPEIQAIVSNSGANIQRAQHRLAKARKAMKRLAKIQKKQAKKVRLQRLKVKKNKLNKKHSKKANKNHKKQSKRIEHQ